MAVKKKKGKPDVDIQVRGLSKVMKEHKKGGDCCGGKKSWSRGCGGCGYFLGFIGSVIYYVSTANGFWMGVLGILKSLVWPAFLVFELLKFLGA